MTLTETPASKPLNHAVNALIESLEATDSLTGLRVGLAPMIAVAEASVSPDSPADREARQLLALWLAFDDLIAAVQHRREHP